MTAVFRTNKRLTHHIPAKIYTAAPDARSAFGVFVIAVITLAIPVEQTLCSVQLHKRHKKRKLLHPTVYINNSYLLLLSEFF